MPTALSPIKSKRLDEKSSLQVLNGRLELYVLRVKEMEDAKNVAERELETIRQRMQADIDALRLRLSKELEDTRKKLDIELDQKARLQVLEQEQHVELVKLRAQVKELSEIKALAESLQVELTKERANSTSSKETLSVQTTQLQAARRRIKDLERDNRSYEASISDVTSELSELRKKAADFDLTRDVEITTIRKEMNLKHQAALAQWKKDTEERLHAVENEVRHYFEGVVAGYKSQVEDLTLEFDSTKKELERTALDYEESLQVRQSLTEKVAVLEREYREERTKFKDDRKKYEATLEHFRSSKFAKEQEFNDLMDVKIALDAEITAYRRILDREEVRVGLPTPTSTPNAKHASMRKRKSESSSGTGGSKRSKRAPSSVQIKHLDLAKDRIVLENTSDKAVSLAGWEVRGRADNQVFRFPSTYSMRPKSTMTVYSSKRNKNAKDERKPDEDSFLATKFSLNASGDFAVLLTADGVPVSTRAEGLPADEVRALEAEIKGAKADGDDDDAPPGEGAGARVDAALLPEIDAAVAFLQAEIAQLERGEHDDRLLELLAAPPVPRSACAALLQVWDVPAAPAELTTLAQQLQTHSSRRNRGRAPDHDLTGDTGDDDDVEVKLPRTRRARSRAPVVATATVADDDDAIDLTGSAESESDDPSHRTGAARVAVVDDDDDDNEDDDADGQRDAEAAAAADADAQTALRTLRTSMLLDVLSKIRSVAKTKGVDPASRTTAALDVLDLDGIAAAVTRGAIAEWDDFAHHVYLFCQLVIADSDASGQLEAKQKGVELLHFARTLTETLRKASAAKEDALRQRLGPAVAVVSSPQSDRGAAAAALTMMQTAKSPLPPAHASPSTKRQSVDALTPNRISARIRQRGSSFSDLASPQATGSAAADDATGDNDDVVTESRRPKRPRTVSNASSSTVATPPMTMTVQTASDDDGERQSESESQVSAASEAESQQSKRRASRVRDTAAAASSAPSSAQTTPVTRTRTRQRRPVLPATRVSSRQQKRRAQRAQAAVATDNDDNGSDTTAAAAAHGGDDDNDNDTAQGEDDDDDHASDSATAAAAGGGETDTTPAAPPVLLTKSGRPRKKPGRKPAGWKKSENK